MKQEGLHFRSKSGPETNSNQSVLHAVQILKKTVGVSEVLKLREKEKEAQTERLIWFILLFFNILITIFVITDKKF